MLCAQTTLACKLITAAHSIHHKIIVQVSYLQHEQLECAWRSVNTNIILTKYMSWMNVKLYFIMNIFLKIISFSRIPFYVRTEHARPVESRGSRDPQLPWSLYFRSLNLTWVQGGTTPKSFKTYFIFILCEYSKI